jgi:hypothetical protein
MPRRRTIHITADDLRSIMREKGRWPIPIRGRRVIVYDSPKRKLVLFGGREIEVSW